MPSVSVSSKNMKLRGTLACSSISTTTLNRNLNGVRRGRRSSLEKFSLPLCLSSDPTRTTLTLMRSEVGIRIGDREKESESGGNRIADIRNAFFPSADRRRATDDSAVGLTPRVYVDSSQCLQRENVESETLKRGIVCHFSFCVERNNIFTFDPAPYVHT